MSFGFPKWTKAVQCIQDAIVGAYKAGVVIFAAARNSGGNDDIAYPANQHEVICISSTDGNGNPSGFNPSAVPGRNFSTLGENVLSSWPQSESVWKSGTSYSTPIAAGIGSLILEYVRHKLPEYEMKIKGIQGMQAILDLMAKERDDFKYIAPWRLFSGNQQENIRFKVEDALSKV